MESYETVESVILRFVHDPFQVEVIARLVGIFPIGCLVRRRNRSFDILSFHGIHAVFFDQLVGSLDLFFSDLLLGFLVLLENVTIRRWWKSVFFLRSS